MERVLALLCTAALALVIGYGVRHGNDIENVFAREHPCPSNHNITAASYCPGHAVTHVCPLACGGKDATYNMRWQTKDEANRVPILNPWRCHQLCQLKR